MAAERTGPLLRMPTIAPFAKVRSSMRGAQPTQLFAGSIFRRYRLGEDARTAVAVIREPAGAALRVALSARERASLHDAVGEPRREPQRQNMVRNVERHLRRKALENLVDLVRHRKSVVFVHLLSRESSTQSQCFVNDCQIAQAI